MKAISCERCRYYDTSVQPIDQEDDTHGTCRKLPPVADDRTGHARFPFVSDTDWCGAFEKHPDASLMATAAP